MPFPQAAVLFPTTPIPSMSDNRPSTLYGLDIVASVVKSSDSSPFESESVIEIIFPGYGSIEKPYR